MEGWNSCAQTCRKFFVRVDLHQTDDLCREQGLRCSREGQFCSCFSAFEIQEGVGGRLEKAWRGSGYRMGAARPWTCSFPQVHKSLPTPTWSPTCRIIKRIMCSLPGGYLLCRHGNLDAQEQCTGLRKAEKPFTRESGMPGAWPATRTCPVRHL